MSYAGQRQEITMTGPVGGTFRFSAGHVKGYDLPYNAPASQAAAERIRVAEADDAIRAVHRRAKLRFLDCEVCYSQRGFARLWKPGVASLARRWHARFRA